MRLAGLLVSLGLIFTAEAARADVIPHDPPHARAIYTSHSPPIDSDAGQEAWKNAPPLLYPNNAQAPGDKNVCAVRFLWNEAGVYLAFHTTDTTPAFGHFKPGEPLYQEDSFEIFIDQVGDHRQYYEIQIDPAGQAYLRNYLLTAPPRLTDEQRLTPEFCETDLWRYDMPLPTDVRIASKLDPQTHAWNLEMFLPAPFVHRRHGGPMTPCTWRINLVRHDWDLPFGAPGRQVKFMYWAPVLPGHPHLSPEQMGFLELVK
jgi:hypothetical protein